MCTLITHTPPFFFTAEQTSFRKWHSFLYNPNICLLDLVKPCISCCERHISSSSKKGDDAVFRQAGMFGFE